jgi:hypothetical protein
VSQSTVQVLVAAVFCAGFLIVIYRLARSERLTFRYTVGWLTLFAFGVLAMVLLPVTTTVSRWLHLSPAGLLATGGLVLLLLICIQLSISISGMQHQIRRLSEEVAKLRLEDNESIRGHAD